jgi:hypothetical protein
MKIYSEKVTGHMKLRECVHCGKIIQNKKKRFVISEERIYMSEKKTIFCSKKCLRGYISVCLEYE